MKRYLYLYMLCLLVFMGSSPVAYSQGKAMDLDDLKAGSVIKIYPNGHYNEASLALACSENGDYLTSYANAGDGDEWTLVDAGDDCYYLKNELGYYWAYQVSSSSHILTCTTDLNSAVKVKFTWDKTYEGICFWNQKDGTGLNNLYSHNESYNWYSSPSFYDKNTTFEVYSSTSSGIVNDVVNGIKYRLNAKDKTAQVCANNYVGEVVIPQTISYAGNDFRVTSLEDKCFSYCGNLTSITLPESITSLSDYCFYECSLTSITLPDGITSLGNYCFGGCRSLTSITLPDGITSLGNYCFSSCRSLTSIALPAGITSLGDGCFSWCDSLTSITLPESITSLSDYCFYECSLTSITLPDGITSLGDGCFSSCHSLTSITLSKNIVSLGKACFQGDDHLKSVILKSKNLPTVGDDCFSDCNIENATLWVNNLLMAICRTTAPWSSFGSIKKLSANWKSFTLTAKGMDMCCSDEDLDFSIVGDAVKAYIASGFDPATGKVQLTRVWEIPAGTGFILRGDEGTYDLTVASTGYVYSNLLVGTLTDTEVPETDGSYTNYVLGNGDNGPGFYRSQGETIQAGKAYLHIPTPAAASLKCIRFSFDDEENGGTTGFIPVKILTSGSAAADAPVYNLNGQRKPGLSKGMNIVGGQKIWVK